VAGYIRQSTADIIPTATVRAAPINAEYNALRDAFAASGGHKHDGTTGEGEYVPLIADLDALNKVVIDTTNNRIGFFVEVSSSAVEQVRIQDGAVVPVTDNDIDLGTSSLEFKDLYLDGTAYIDTLAVHESATITANLTVNGNTTLGNAASDTVTVTADVASHLIPSVDFTYDLGAVGSEWRNLYIDGTANIDSLVADTADINAGTIDNTVIGGTTAAAASVTTLDASSNATVSGTLDVTGATTLTSTLAVTGNTTVGGTLGITGATTLSSFSATSADINGGNIDGTDIGTSAVGTGAFSTVSATGNITGNLVGNVTGNVTGNTTGDLTGNVTSSGTSTFATVDINGGAIDGTTIGATSAAAITGTTITGTSLVGPLTGNVTGDVTGDLTGNVTASSGNTSLNNLTVNGTIDATNTTINNVSDPTTSAQAATKNYVDTQINNLIGGAPSTLDTLNEIADALNDDASAYATLDTKIDTKLTKAGDTMSGNLAMGANKITGLATPTTGTDAVNLTYVTTLFGSTASAATSATNAATSETNAATSATNAANSYDSFDDRYLGVKTGTLPSTDNDGDALITGALLFDGTNNVMKVWNGSEWAAASSSIEGIKSSFRYVATASQTVFSGADANSSTLVIDQAGLVNVFLNGVRLVQGSGQDYTVSAANNNVTLLTGAAVNDVVEIEVFGNFAGQSGAEVAITGGSITGLSALGVAGNASFGDNNKAIFGAGSDLQIYSTGTNGFIENNTGLLILKNNSDDRDIALQSDDGSGGVANYLLADGSTGSLKAYHYGNEKLATTSTGVNITGTLSSDKLSVSEGSSGATANSNADGVVVENNSKTGISILTPNNSEGLIFFGDPEDNNIGRISYNHTSNAMSLVTNNNTRLNIASNGDISFYEDTGTTAKLFWDASAESLQIGSSGTATPAANLIINDTAASGFKAKLTSSAFNVDGNWLGLGMGYYSGYMKSAIIAEAKDGNARANLHFALDSDTGSGNVGLADAKMTVTYDGNVGIGTTSPSAPLDIEHGTVGEGINVSLFSTTQSNGPVLRLAHSLSNTVGTQAAVTVNDVLGKILFAGSDGSSFYDGAAIIADASQTFSGTAGGTRLEFYTTDSGTQTLDQRMVIDQDGSVGIGTDSPNDKVDISGSTGDGYRLTDGTHTGVFRSISGGTILKTTTNHALLFGTNDTEAMRIDSSGNLLVGTTSAGGSNGITFHSSGYIQPRTNTGIPAIYADREGSDGSIIELRKDGAPVGSIGSSTNIAGNFYIAGSSGLQFRSDDILPTNGSGVYSSGAVDLGDGGANFRNLYLSGGVTFGSTGGSVTSKTLDDYEEGTWTPTCESGSLSFISANYTKVGNLVTVTANVYNFSDTTSSTSIGINNLPFTSTFANRATGAMIGRYISSTKGYSAYIGANSTVVYFYEAPEATNAYETMKHSDLGGSDSDFVFTVTYRV